MSIVNVGKGKAMDEYKEAIEKFLDNLEELDMRCDYDKLTERDAYLFLMIRGCRNKLAETYNCIGDEAWTLPDFSFNF